MPYKTSIGLSKVILKKLNIESELIQTFYLDELYNKLVEIGNCKKYKKSINKEFTNSNACAKYQWIMFTANWITSPSCAEEELIKILENL